MGGSTWEYEEGDCLIHGVFDENTDKPLTQMDVFMLFVINVLGCKRHLFDVKTMCVCVCVCVGVGPDCVCVWRVCAFVACLLCTPAWCRTTVCVSVCVCACMCMCVRMLTIDMDACSTYYVVQRGNGQYPELQHVFQEEV